MKVGAGIRYDFFDFRLDVETQQLLKNGQPVQLTHKAFQILLLLVQNSGRTCKKEDIFDRLWADSFVEDANLTQHVYVLRKILGKTPNGEPYIETVPRQGYRFTLAPEQISVVEGGFSETPDASPQIPDVEESDEFSHSSGESEPVLPAEDDFDSAQNPFIHRSDDEEKLSRRFPAAPKKASLLSSTVVLTLLVFVVFGGAAAVYYFRQSAVRQASVSDFKSIAVLPFKVIGDETDDEKLGFGMADAVITQLSRLQQLEVRPTSAVFRYTGLAELQTVSVGRQLNVDVILEGTIQRDAGRFRVSIQLIRVADGNSLWAETFHEKASDIFAVQDLISRRVVAALSLRLTPQQERTLSEQTTGNPAARQDFQLGVYFLNKRTKDDLLRSAEYFRQAVDHDPGYAQAWAGLADSYSMLAYYRFADVDETKEKAKAAAEKALSLNDSLAEAYVALAMAYVVKKEDLVKAQALLERAVALAPYNATVRHRYGWILLTNGRLDEGAREMRLAKDYDPLSPATNRAYCSVLVMQRNFAEAVAQCETALDIYLDTPNSRRALARAYFYNGRYSDAFDQLEIQIKSGTEYEVVSARAEIAYYYAKLGRTAEAERIYAELKKTPGDDPRRASGLALIAFALGKKNESLTYFREMMKSSDTIPDSHLSLAYDPFWDEIKADPQFAALFPK